MIIQSNQIVLSSPFDLGLNEWTNAVIETAIGEGFICMPCEPDDAFVLRLQAYYNTGLTPAEAVSACFHPTH